MGIVELPLTDESTIRRKITQVWRELGRAWYALALLIRTKWLGDDDADI